MPFPPSGFKSQEYPLRHTLRYSFALSAVTPDHSSAWMPIIRSSLECTQANAKTILVNPHNTAQDRETGAMCTPMSIIQNLTMSIRISGLRLIETDEFDGGIHGWWMPFYCAFPEKYDATDDDTGVSVATIMHLTKDDTNEDIVPFTTQKLDTTGSCDFAHSMSTVNFTEVFGTLNYTTDTTMESADFDEAAFHELLRLGTNKGALKSCLGRARHFNIGGRNSNIPNTKTYHIKGFLPKVVRRVMPFGFFGILVNVPTAGQDTSQSYTADASLTADKGHIGVRTFVSYDEWNELHDNTM